MWRGLEGDVFLLEQLWKWSMFWRQAIIFHKSISNASLVERSRRGSFGGVLRNERNRQNMVIWIIECNECGLADLWIGEVWHALLPIYSNGLGLRANLEVLGPIGVDYRHVHTTHTYFCKQKHVLYFELYETCACIGQQYIMSMHICEIS